MSNLRCAQLGPARLAHYTAREVVVTTIVTARDMPEIRARMAEWARDPGLDGAGPGFVSSSAQVLVEPPSPVCSTVSTTWHNLTPGTDVRRAPAWSPDGFEGRQPAHRTVPARAHAADRVLA
jgi:hypothetical protein